MSYVFGKRSTDRLATCHPLLITLFQRVIRRPDLPHDLSVVCGHRGKADQEAVFTSGASKLRWPKSKHNATPSHAVDVAPFVGGAISWHNPHYDAVAPIVKAEWAKMVAEGVVPAGVTLEWGGDWVGLHDGPHWQLSGIR